MYSYVRNALVAFNFTHHFIHSQIQCVCRRIHEFVGALCGHCDEHRSISPNVRFTQQSSSYVCGFTNGFRIVFTQRCQKRGVWSSDSERPVSAQFTIIWATETLILKLFGIWSKWEFNPKNLKWNLFRVWSSDFVEKQKFTKKKKILVRFHYRFVLNEIHNLHND